ncbi:ACT domain-containing protein [Pontibacterium granulatum]|uniref:ACT domain-containing protein n=1 Tax=Pontibacterium granulatum TaxID=2036029 RepID=UPI002499FBDC|nr:ACT domain-containing protein [Pontibacterium granulatum]MDI3326575.1 ACT domain-containing protein [Pontibacterium granulatum]
MVTWVLTVTGEDQPELFKRFCELLAMMEGIILDSQQAVLGGHCTAIYKVCLPKQHLSFAHRQFAAFAVHGLEIVLLKEIEDDCRVRQHLSLDIKGAYRFGLEHDIRRMLESYGARVSHLNHDFQKQSLWDGVQMRLHIKAELSRPLSESRLENALGGLTSGLCIKLGISELKSSLAS